MNITIQNESENLVSANEESDAFEASETIENYRSNIRVADVKTDEMRKVAATIRKFQPLRFATGLLCTAAGVALILGAGLRVIEVQNAGAGITLPLIGICVLVGVMLVGG